MARNKDLQTNGGKRKILFLSVFFILSLLCIVFSSLTLHGSSNSFIQRYFLWFSIAASMLVIIAFLLVARFIYYEKESLVKAFLSAYLFVLFCLILVYVLQITGFFKVFNDAEQLQAYLQRAGVWMPLTYILLQFLQVIILPVPGIVSTAAGVAVFGPFFTAIYSIIGIVLGSFVAFFIGRKWGNQTVVWMIGEETLKKWQKRLKGKDNLFLTTMFILPLFPDDVLCFVAGLSTMSTRYFSIMIVLSRIIAIFTTCYSVNFIPLNTWWGITIWVVLLVGIITLFILLYKHIDKIQLCFKRRKRQRKNQKKEKNNDF